jgi:iron complex transport system ATP-binding protein
MNLINVKNAAFSYDSSKEVFHDISIEVNAGEAFLIVGPNGCGKSTLIDNLLGLLKLKSGRIEIGGKDIKSMKPKEIAEHLAYVPQWHEKSFGYKVIDIVLMGRTYASKMFSPPSEEERLLALKAMEQVGLKGFEDKEYTKLSGGELQLVMIARALTQKSALLLMDEPTAHLDFCHELNILEIITDLVKNKGLSVIMATHFLNQAYYLENAGVNTKVALMNKGRFQKTGTPSEILTPENLKGAFNIITEVAGGGPDKRKYILALYSDKD